MIKLWTSRMLIGALCLEVTACGEARRERDELSRDAAMATDAAAPHDAARDAECSSGEVDMKRCDTELCFGLNETSVATCGDDGQFGPCTCVVPRDDCAALDCAAGYLCYAGKCLDTKRCAERACEDGFECLSSVCSQVLTASEREPVSMALGEGALYVSQLDPLGRPSRIERLDLSSGAVTELAVDTHPVGPIVIDDERAYWVSGEGVNPQRIVAVPQRGGATTTLIDNVRPEGVIHMHQGALYLFDWDGSDANLRRVSTRDNAQPELVLKHHAAVRAMVIHRDQVVWVNEPHEVWRARLDGSNPTRLETFNRWPEHLIAAEDGVLALWTQPAWLVGASLYRFDSNQEARLAAYESRHVASIIPMAIAAQDSMIFWLFYVVEDQVTESGYAYLQRTDLESGKTHYVWSTDRLDERAGMVVDDQFIYINNPKGREILRIINRW